MTGEDLANNGYRLYIGGAAKLRHADRYYAKMLRDDIGKKYQIIVYIYDWTKVEGIHRPESGFQPEVQFHNREIDLCVDITLHNRPDFSVEYVEAYFERMWAAHGQPYYEVYYDE